MLLFYMEQLKFTTKKYTEEEKEAQRLAMEQVDIQLKAVKKALKKQKISEYNSAQYIIKKEYFKQYYIDHKEKIDASNKKRYSKTYMREYMRKWRATHREEYNEYHKEYYKKNN